MTDKPYHAGSVDARVLRLRDLARALVPSATWRSFFERMIVLFAVSSAGLYFRSWIRVHWIETGLFLALLCVAVLGISLWVIRAANKLLSRQMDAIYADVVLCWIKQNISGRGYLSTSVVSEALHLPMDQALRGLTFLQEKKLIEAGPGDQWIFNPEAAFTVTPYFARNPLLNAVRQQ